MRLRNIPGAQDAILESPYVVQEPQTKKGHWGEVFVKKQPLHIEVGMGKGRFLMDVSLLIKSIFQHLPDNGMLYPSSKSIK